MKKLNAEIPKKDWGTLKTKYPSGSDFVEYNEVTNDSKNFDTTSKGVVSKRLGGVNYNSSTFSGAPKDQYEAIFSDGTRHLLAVSSGTLRYSSGDGSFNSVTSGYSTTSNFEFTTYQDRVYFGNSVNNPQVYDRTTSYGGVVYTAPKTKDMGAQIPSSTVTYAADTAGGSVPAGAHTYKVTYLYYDSEESNGSSASAVHTVVAPNQTVNLTSVPIGGYGVTARKIYRDNNDGVWLLVGTINDNTTTTFADTASTGTSSIPTTNNIPPSFKYIVTHLDRNWIAGIPGSPSTLAYSNPGQPNIFPSTSTILCNPRDPIMGIVVYNDQVYVLNRNSLGKIVGRTKDSFRYSEIPSTIGCVDNRSIQINTMTGVPFLMWLSDKGIYGTNGSSIEYLSDPIEDIVNLNIQQSTQVKGQNAQTTTTQFDSGTKSAAILTAGGTITVANPQRIWDDETDWSGGSSNTNAAIYDNLNAISAVTRADPAFADGTFANTQEVSSTLRTPVYADFTGDNIAVTQGQITSPPFAIYEKFVFDRSGVVTGLQMFWAASAPGYSFEVRTDTAGQPGALQYVSPVAFDDSPIYGNHGAPAFSVTAGVTYWIGVTKAGYGTFQYVGFSSAGVAKSQGTVLGQSGLGFVSLTGPSFSPATHVINAFSFSQYAVATSGNWTSETYDSQSSNAVGASVIHTGVFPSGTSSITTVEAANDEDFTSGLLSQTFNNLNGTGVVTLSGRRYWRVKISLDATDDRNTAQIGAVSLRFSTSAEWISAAIDHTTDITSLASLSMVSTVPGGTSVTLEIATSADNITYSPFTSVGSATPQRYSKVRLTFTTDAGNSLTASVSSVTLNWTVSANLQSVAIDTGVTPAGFDIFQAQYAENGGTALFYLRTAASLGALTSATYYAVTNGQFPTISALQYVQWKVVLTASANSVPTVDSVTINWFISSTASLRVASLFYNRSYYLACAEYNQTANNIIIVFDGERKWRLYRGITAATMSFFFNDPYYGSATEGRIVRFLQGSTDQGAAIEMIIDTKDIDLQDKEHTKILRKVYLHGYNTGATYTVQYSLDSGETFYTMLDVLTGNSSYTTDSDGQPFSRRFQPDFNAGNPVSGLSVMIRIKESTTNEARIEKIKAEFWLRAGEAV